MTSRQSGSIHSANNGVKRATKQNSKCGECGDKIHLGHRITKATKGWKHYPICPKERANVSI